MLPYQIGRLGFAFEKNLISVITLGIRISKQNFIQFCKSPPQSRFREQDIACVLLPPQESSTWSESW